MVLFVGMGLKGAWDFEENRRCDCEAAMKNKAAPGSGNQGL